MVNLRDIPHAMATTLTRVAYQWLLSLKTSTEAIGVEAVSELYKTETDLSEALSSGELAVLSISEKEDSELSRDNQAELKNIIMETITPAVDNYNLLTLLSLDNDGSDFSIDPKLLTSVDDLDVLTDGWYRWGLDNPANSPFDYAIMVQFNDVSQKIQLAYGGESLGKIAVRRTEAGVFYVWTGAGSGDVLGPGSSTDKALVRFDGITGKSIRDSGAILSDIGTLILPGALFVNGGTLSVNGNSIKADEVAPQDLDIFCGAAKTIELQTVVYEDLQVSISNVKVPTSRAPTERLYNHGIVGGVTFPVLGFALNEYIYFDVQTSHSMKLNTVLDNHIHFMTPTDGTGDRFKFQLDVIASGIGGSWAVPTGSPFTPEHIITADYSNKHELFEIADIPAANTTVSSIYSCKLTRIAATTDEYSGEIYIKFSDCHYQKNTMGSRSEGSK